MPAPCVDLTVDFVLEEREKSWKIKLGDTEAWLAKSLWERVSEFTFNGPVWMARKIEAAA